MSNETTPVAPAKASWFQTIVIKAGLGMITSPAVESLIAELVDGEIPANEVAIVRDALTGIQPVIADLIKTNPTSTVLPELANVISLLLANLPTVTS